MAASTVVNTLAERFHMEFARRMRLAAIDAEGKSVTYDELEKFGDKWQDGRGGFVFAWRGVGLLRYVWRIEWMFGHRAHLIASISTCYAQELREAAAA